MLGPDDATGGKPLIEVLKGVAKHDLFHIRIVEDLPADLAQA